MRNLRNASYTRHVTNLAAWFGWLFSYMHCSSLHALTFLFSPPPRPSSSRRSPFAAEQIRAIDFPPDQTAERRGAAGDEHDCLVFRRISIGFIAPLPFLCCCRNLNSAPAPFNANMKALAQEAVKKVYKRRGRRERERGSERREGYDSP